MCDRADDLGDDRPLGGDGQGLFLPSPDDGSFVLIAVKADILVHYVVRDDHV